MAKRSLFLDECEVSGTDSSDESEPSTQGSLVDFIASEDGDVGVNALLEMRAAQNKRPRIEESQESSPSERLTPEIPVLSRTPCAPIRPSETAVGRARRSRRFALTLNNFVEEDKAKFKSLPNTRYRCYGVEGVNRTPHLQCYLELPRSRQLTIVGLRKEITQHWGSECRFHIEIAVHDGATNRNYCQKESNEFWEDGEQPIGNGNTRGQGKRSDLDEVCSRVKSGASFVDVAQICPKAVIKYHRGIRVLMKTLQYTVRSLPTKGYWCWGPTGSGKSRWAFSLTPNSTYVKDPMSRFFCGYAQEETVIVDDFRPNKEIPFSFLLRLADRYPMSVQVKGEDSVQFNSKRIVITCPHNIDETFRHLDFLSDGDLAQLKRRFTEVNFAGDSIVPNLSILDQEHPVC